MESFFDFTITPFYYIGMAVWKIMLILIGVTAGETPQAFSEGTWNYITQSLYPLFLAIGSTLLNVFFLIGYLRSVSNLRDGMTLEMFIELCIKVALGNLVIQSIIPIMEQIFDLAGGISKLLIAGTDNPFVQSDMDGGAIFFYAMMSKSEKSRTIAKGWVEVENCIKFPVFVRTYIDKETQEEKMFVSMPQRKGVKGYSNIISFENKETREEIEDVVLKTVLKQAFKSFEKVSILETKITLLPEDTKNRQVKIKGIASIKLEGGIRIQSILIKEGKNGLFVEMPQYFSEGSYHDTVYGTSEAMRDELSGKILEAYKKQMELQLHPELAEKETKEENLEAEQKRPEIPVEEVKREKQPENPDVPESGTEKELVSKQESETVTESENANEQDAAEEIKEEPVLSWEDRFVAAFAERNKEEVLALLAELRGAPRIISSEKTDDILIMEQAEYSINEKTSILLIFDNTYEKDREIKEGTDIRQEITVVLKEKGKKPGMLPVIKLSSHNLEDAEARYKEAVRSWQTLTHQNIAPDIEPVLNSQQQPAGEPKSEMKEEIEESIDEEPESAEEVKTVEETEQEKEQNVPESGTQQEINVAVDKEEVTGQKETGQTG